MRSYSFITVSFFLFSSFRFFFPPFSFVVNMPTFPSFSRQINTVWYLWASSFGFLQNVHRWREWIFWPVPLDLYYYDTCVGTILFAAVALEFTLEWWWIPYPLFWILVWFFFAHLATESDWTWHELIGLSHTRAIARRVACNFISLRLFTEQFHVLGR